ncbi:MAG: response regulator [Chloroflexi bacterium]|nr:MAG: response regulator [Chloroflexota bacterium]MBL1193477.1 response regulator [Chloroflexota bacterium]NOH10768.1 response regulator [Chloroflexota bacterium]
MSNAQQNGHQPQETPKLTALIIDDDKTNRQLFARVIESYGYQVLAITNGAEAISVLDSRDVHIVLLDVMMPDENGFEICRQIKDKPETADIPVILMTALFDPQSRSEARLAGANAFFSKPFDMDELKRTMQNLTSSPEEPSSLHQFPQT